MTRRADKSVEKPFSPLIFAGFVHATLLQMFTDPERGRAGSDDLGGGNRSGAPV